MVNIQSPWQEYTPVMHVDRWCPCQKVTRELLESSNILVNNFSTQNTQAATPG
jgi:hypothetical protein